MRIRETCGCGASIDVEDRGDWAIEAATGWRSNHKHVPCRPESTESDEQGADVHADAETGSDDLSASQTPERDPRSTVASSEALSFGFGGYGESEVIA